MNILHRWRLTIAAVAATCSLLACGGGSDNPASPAVAAAPPPLTGSPAPVTLPQDPSAPALTGNIAIDGRNWLNYRRSQVGVPVVAQNAAIDRAAQAHSDYQKINDKVTHDEIAGKPGFTGVNLFDRLKAGGYAVGTTYAIGEVISATTNNSGFYMAEELITAIYHRFVIFEPKFREIGTGAATAAGGYNYFTSDFGTASGFGTGIGRGNIVTWPFNGQTLVTPNFFSNFEAPDPVPDRNEVGYPVSVHADINVVLGVQSFTIRPHGGADLAVRLLTKDVDPETPASAAAIVPLEVLRASTVYDVTFTGTTDGVAVSKSWSFTTK
jgi:uncharacterized protein YkwD